jgi:hypothetical protein
MSAAPLALPRPIYHVRYGIGRLQRMLRRYECDLWRIGFEIVAVSALGVMCQAAIAWRA